MLELVYPEIRARLIGNQEGEMLPIINTFGEVTGRASRSVVHSRGFLHPVVHLHIIDRFSKIYLQKRSMTKDLLPGRWDTSVGGHVGFGEYVMEALYREASEEIGLCDFNPIFIDSHIYDNYGEQELSVIFAAVGHFECRPDPDEVSEGRWWSVEEIDDSLGLDIFTPQFEEEYKRLKNKLINLL